MMSKEEIMFHLRNRKRPPKPGETIVARCGWRTKYRGTMWGAENDECCQICLDRRLPTESGFDPLYILPEHDDDILNSEWGHLFIGI